MCLLASVGTDPQKSAPCITAIGYNGVNLWQNGMVFLWSGNIVIPLFILENHNRQSTNFSQIELILHSAEGFVGADILASSLEKAWLSLHIQVGCADYSCIHHHSLGTS